MSDASRYLLYYREAFAFSADVISATRHRATSAVDCPLHGRAIRWCGFKRSGAMVRHRLASHSPQRSPTPMCVSRRQQRKGRWGKVRALQRLLTHSSAARFSHVRRVTENDGKETPGVDREIWDTPEKKTQAVHELKRRGYQPQPLRRVYIPKSDGKTMRPLEFPPCATRAQQALYLLALDPIMETTADKNSYGFRQQAVLRGCD